MSMHLGERLSLFLKICLPLIFLVAISAYPRSYAVADALRAAQSAQSMGLHQAAASALRQVLENEPWRSPLWETLGREELASGRLPEAIAALKRADQAGSLSPDGRFQLGEAYLQQGDTALAEATWQALLKTEGPSGRVYARLAQVQGAHRDYPAVLATLRGWHSLAPDDVHVTYLLGLNLTAQQPDQALPLLLEAAQQDASYSADVQTLRNGLGLAANASDPAYGWVMIGRALASIEQWGLAAVTFQKAVKISPQYAEGWAFLGEARYHLDGTGKTELNRALALNQQSPVVQALLALFWRRQGAPDKALPYLEAIARQEPKEPTWQVEIGNTLVEAGDLELARAAFQQAVDLAPQQAVYYQYLARFSIEYNVDVRDVGLPAARQAILIAPDDPGSLDAMGWTMATLGDAASAERFLQRAVDKDATYALALLHLGQLYLQQQDAEKAHPYLKRAASLAGDNPTGMVARRLLQRYYGEGQ